MSGGGGTPERETRIALGVCERDRLWRSHTGCLFRWSEASSTWTVQWPGSDKWVDLHIRTAFANQSTPFEADL